MKAENLKILKLNNVNVPDFIAINNRDNFDMSFSDAKFFAIRSSCHYEDSANLSYAGMFETILNVPRADVKKAVDAVFDSYTKAEKYGDEETDIDNDTVIIQEMITEPDYSGVIFTSNPLGLLNETVIIVGQGIGEDVVSEKTDVTTYYYNTADERFCYNRNNDSPLLSEEILEKLISEASKIREIFGFECDIEFCIKNEIIYILQSRKITTIDESQKKIILDNSNIVESYPGVVLPLSQDFVKSVYTDIMNRLLKRMTHSDKLVESFGANMVDFVDGKAYYDISTWYTMLGLMPFSKKIIPIWQEMLGVENKYVSKNKLKVTAFRKIVLSLNLLYYFIANPFYMKAVNSRFEKSIETYRKNIKETTDVEGLVELYRRIQREVMEYWDLTLVNDLYAFVFTHLAKKHSNKIKQIGRLASMEPVILQSKLKEAYTRHGFGSSEYEKVKAEYIDKFGDRCLGELKLETKTYRTNPELLDEFVAGEHITSDVMCVDRRRHFEPKMSVRHAKIGILNRESSRLNRTRVYGFAREIFLKIGELLVAQGRLDDQRDVFYIHINELTSDEDMRRLTEARKRVYEQYATIPTFSRYIFLNEIFSKTITNNMNEVNVKSKDKFMGEVVSKPYRKVKGEVLVMKTPDPTIPHKDKIIVTEMTDPGWVMILQDAKGIIAEKGSFLSHTAIISRELKKPSIVNVKGAMSMIKTGDIVEIDLDEGVIRKNA